MNIRYDKNVDALYIDLAKGSYDISKKITDTVIVDLTKAGKVLGIEILDASETIQSFDPKQIMSTLQYQNNQRVTA